MTNHLRRYLSLIKPLVVNRYIVFFAFLFSATEILQHYGGLPSFTGAWRFEIPLLLYLYYYANLILRPSRRQALVAAAPIILFYLGFDIYFVLLGRLPHITEFSELPEMFGVLPVYVSLLIVAVIALPLYAFLTSTQYRKPSVITLGALPLLALLLAVERTPDWFMDTFEKTQGEIVFYSDAFSTRNNGRLGMMLYNEARRKSYLSKVAKYRDNATYKQEFDKTVGKVKDQTEKRNIHMVVLESFLDPNLMQGAQYSRSPFDPSFEEIFHDKAGFSISPVFGGGTAQAEFEVLCGVPALRELSGVEFNVFTGSKTYCLPNILTQGGYETDSTNSYVPDFYNSTNAYAGMGFANTYYPSEYAVGRETYFSRGDVTGEDYMFDGDLFSQNLEFISKRIKEAPDRPLFNYLISMYGHLPHEINTDKRPMVIGITGKVKDEQFERAVNQFYYRTKAIAAFVKGLIQVDPHSLIILVSDHLPPLSYGPNTYRDLNYFGGTEEGIHQNRVFIIENGQAVRYNTIHHYDIPRIVLNYITKGKYCQEHTCNFKSNEAAPDKTAYRDEYMAIMAEAMGCDTPPSEVHHDEEPAAHHPAPPSAPAPAGA